MVDGWQFQKPGVPTSKGTDLKIEALRVYMFVEDAMSAL